MIRILRIVALAFLLLPALTWSGDSSVATLAEGKKRFELHCKVCHSLELPESQNLDRNTWRWVIDDMVNEFGATWLTDEDQTLILEYLVTNYGPKR